MGKTYKKNNVEHHTLYDKKQTHDRQRKANKCTDWENNERALPVTKHRKYNLLSDQNRYLDNTTTIPNRDDRSLDSVCKIGHWTKGSPESQHELLDQLTMDESNDDPAYVAACQKQLQRRGHLGAFRGHNKSKQVRL